MLELKKLAYVIAIAVELCCPSPMHAANDPYATELHESRRLLDAVKVSAALPHLMKAVAMKPNDYRGYVMRSECYRRLSNLDQALLDANKAIALNPNVGDGYYERASIYQWQRRSNEARRDLQKAAGLGHKQAQQFLAVLGPPASEFEEAWDQAAREPDNDKAIVLYNKAINLKPNCRATVYWRRGQRYAAKHLYGEAILDYSEAIKRDPDWSIPYIARGRAYEAGGQKSQAEKDFDRALALPAEEYDGRLERSQLELKRGKYEDAIEDANVAIYESSQNTDAYLVTGEAYSKLGHFEKAAAEYTKAINNSDTYMHSMFLGLRASMYDKLHRTQDAAKDRALAKKKKSS